jgi:hypothetical protein
MTVREELAQEWRERLQDFAASEMTVQQWCDFNRVSPYQYYYWRRRLAAKTDRATDPVPQGNWMTLNVVDAPPLPATPSGVTICIAGAVIEVAAGFDPAMLRAVVRALATDPC